nr:MAG: Caspase domain-containing protein [Candidatus Kentron sp. TUN]VFK65905.1 MAG: Caspase domain-containing protein [Candidatus Kentron sp. TUN]
MAKAGNRINIVMLDACRNNPFLSGSHSRSHSRIRGLAVVQAKSGSIVSYATAPGKTASDGKGRNSPYTAALIDNIRTPGFKIEEMFKQVRIQVEKLTNGAQTPWENSSLTSDFFFGGKNAN